MPRLNDKARKILWDEVERCSGTPATREELQQVFSDLLPNFSQIALKKSAIANQPLGKVGKFVLAAGISAVSLLSLGGLLWLVNLPYPMIRRPVARTAPLLLLPSYLNMDRN